MKVSVFFMVLTFLLTFYSRSVLIGAFGNDLVGLNATIVDILGFLNLAELGIVSAVSGLLYKEIYNNDNQAIKKIISVFGYWYRCIGVSILAIGILFSFFLPFIFKSTNIDLIDIFLCYYSFLFTTLLGYFVNYTQTLLVADQKEYVVTSGMNFFLIVKLILQIILLTYVVKSFLIYLICEIVFGVLYSIYLCKIVVKYYPWLNVNLRDGKMIQKEYQFLIVKIKNIIPHKISAFVQYQSANVIIYSFTSLSVVTIYTNYTLILMKGVSFLKLAFNGTVAGIGNLIAENNLLKTLSVFKEYNSLFYFLGGVITICLYYLVPPFMSLWLGNEYLLGHCTFCVLLFNVYVNIIRNSVMFFIGAYVLYEDVYAPICEATITIFFSVLLGYFWGITGVLLGNSISLLTVIVIWKPYYLFSRSFKISVKIYWIDSLKYIVLFLITFLIISLLVSFCSKPISIATMIIHSVFLFFSSAILYALLLLIFDRGFRNLFRRIIYMVKS